MNFHSRMFVALVWFYRIRKVVLSNIFFGLPPHQTFEGYGKLQVPFFLPDKFCFERRKLSVKNKIAINTENIVVAKQRKEIIRT